MTGTTDLETGYSALGLSKEAAPETGSDDDISSEDESDSDDLAPGIVRDNDLRIGSHSASVSGPTVRHCACFPDHETEDQCKARIVRIVEKQKKCYGTSKHRY